MSEIRHARMYELIYICGAKSGAEIEVALLAAGVA
jgi:hypothetical protein